MRETNDGFTVDPDDLYYAKDEEDLKRWSRTRVCLQPIGRKYDPEDPTTAVWSPQVTIAPLEADSDLT